ncbi:carboxypeptidase-like regulatory domain-containing protein [Henriciella sp.]|uniref:carboxypeptidase-like regulatory domain-containing protein n=1 Tax=Henriciella sp. TaxID=1968823 RepID=UPI0026274EAC|nr:carboxypeptidase-like regulatory domain-containing protein [Henriciella sp.]
MLLPMMSWVFRISALLSLATLLASVSAMAGDRGPDMPLSVSWQAGRAIAPSYPAAAGPVGLHKVQIGTERAFLRIQYAVGGDLIDPRGLVSALGRDIREAEGSLIFDRPQTEKRAELDLADGALLIDGRVTGHLDLAEVRTGNRIWLSASILEAMTGQTVVIEGREREPPVATGSAKPERAQDMSALMLPRQTRREAEPAQLLLASFRGGASRNLTSGKAKGADYAGVRSKLPSFAEAFDDTVQMPTQREAPTDWRARTSWDVVPVIDGEELQETPKPRLQPVSLRRDITRSERGPSPTSAKLRERPKPKAHGLNQPFETRPKLLRVKAVPEQTLESVRSVFPSEVGMVASNSSQTSRPKPYRGTDVLYARLREAVAGLSSERVEVTPAVLEEVPVESVPSALNTTEIRGTVFLDRDGDGRAGERDQSLEGEVLSLIRVATGEIVEKRSAAFGRYVFADLPPGFYRLRAMVGWTEHVRDVQITSGESVVDLSVAIGTGPPDPQQRRHFAGI